jgi:hypothetical protein
MIMRNYPVEQEECRCPFYGFSRFEKKEMKVLFGGNSNQCPIKSDKDNLYPCQMEVNGQHPDWRNCVFNKEGLEKKFSDFHVVIIGSNSEISFEWWYREVMGEEPEF